MNKKALSGLILVLLLLSLGIATHFALQNWMKNYTSSLTIDTEQERITDTLEVVEVDGGEMIIDNKFQDDLVLSEVVINNQVCTLSNQVIDKGVVAVDIGNCISTISQLGAYDVKLVTASGVVSSIEGIDVQSSSGLIATFKMGGCNGAIGEVRLYGLTDMNNSHVDIDSSQVYSLCVRKPGVILSTTGAIGGDSQHIFYLSGDSNSAVYIDNAVADPNPGNWYDLILYSNSGNFVYQVGGVQPVDTTCIGKIDRDDIYGAHIGDCDSTLPDTIWLGLE